MTIESGNEGGIKFRANGNPGYFFHVTREGDYRLFKTVPGTTPDIDLIRSRKPNPAIKIGMKQSNVLTVLAQGPTIHLYVNDRYLDTAQDTTFDEGGIAVCAKDYSKATNTTEITFKNVRVWQL